MEILELERENEKEWNEFIFRSANATFYHQIGWKNAVEKTYGHRPCYLIAKEDGELKGILPLFLISSRIFGSKLVSIPFAPYGGVCAETSEAEGMLIEEAKRIAKVNGVDYLEIRSLYNNYLYNNEFKLITNNPYFTLILKLERDSELLWKKFSRKVRNAIRKAMKSNFEIIIDDKIRNFYPIYSKNMRDLGTPVHSYQFFKNLLSEFSDTKIISVEYEGKIIASIFLLCFKNTIISGWASSDKSYQKVNPNNLIYWEAIKKGCECGYEYFDFGRSIVNSGTYRFKLPWGAEPRQLYYQYYLSNARQMPDTSQINPKRKIFAKVWRKLPLSLTERIGPRLRREFP